MGSLLTGKKAVSDSNQSLHFSLPAARRVGFSVLPKCENVSYGRAANTGRVTRESFCTIIARHHRIRDRPAVPRRDS